MPEYSYTYHEYLDDGHTYTLMVTVVADDEQQARRLADAKRDDFVTRRRDD